MSKPTTMIFGATGKIGGALIERLIPDHATGNMRIVAAVRRPESRRALEDRGIETTQIDLDAPELEGLESLIEAMRGVDRVFLLTGYTVRMLAQSKAVVDAAKHVGASHLVHVGAYALADTTSSHLAWHQFVEAYVERSGLPFTHLRPNWFMQQLLSWGRSDGPGVLVHYVGDARPSWIDCDDIAEVAAAVLRNPVAHAGRAYDLATEAASLHEIAALVAEVTGLPWRYDAQEPKAFLERALASGGEPTYMSCGLGVFTRTRAGAIPETSNTFDTVERVAGRPATRLRSFVEKHRAEFLYTPAR